MNIVHAVPYFPPASMYGGVPQAVYALAHAQANQGHNVTVMTTDAGLDQQTASIDLQLQESPNNHIAYIGHADRLKIIYFKNRYPGCARRFKVFSPWFDFDYLNTIPIDVMHLHEVHIIGYRQLARYGLSRANCVCLSAHGSLKPPVHKGLKRLIHAGLDPLMRMGWFKRLPLYLALSDQEKEQYRQCGIDESRIKIIPHGQPEIPDTSEPFPFEYEENQALCTFLYLGRLAEVKGVIVLVKAFLNLLEQGTSARLILCGPDEGAMKTIFNVCAKQNKPIVENIVKQEAGIYRLPAIPNTMAGQLIQKMDCVVCPSFYESFGLVPIEALSQNTPVIITTAYGCLQHITNQTNNPITIIPPNDVNALTNALNKHASLPSGTLTNTTQVSILPTWHEIAESVEDLYNLKHRCVS